MSGDRFLSGMTVAHRAGHARVRPLIRFTGFGLHQEVGVLTVKIRMSIIFGLVAAIASGQRIGPSSAQGYKYTSSGRIGGVPYRYEFDMDSKGNSRWRYRSGAALDTAEPTLKVGRIGPNRCDSAQSSAFEVLEVGRDKAICVGALRRP